MRTWHVLLAALLLAALTAAYPDKLGEELEHEEEYEEEDKRPYSFSYAASRHYNGAPDREHQEQRGEDGITRGVFRYIDPRYQVQEIVYYSDDDGFHVDASNLPQDTVAVQSARNQHAALFESIRLEHARIAAERELLESLENQEYQKYDDPRENVQEIVYYVDPSKLPKDTEAVFRAKNYHATLFEQIKQDHARIGAETELLKAQRNQEYQQ